MKDSLIGIIDSLEYAVKEKCGVDIFVNPKDEQSSFKMSGVRINDFQFTYETTDDPYSPKIDILIVHSSDFILPIYNIISFSYTDPSRSIKSELMLSGYSDKESMLKPIEIILQI